MNRAATVVTFGRAARWLAACAGAAALIALWLDPAAFGRAWLVGFVVWLGLPLGALGFLLLHGLCGGTWGDAVRGVLEALVRTMPLALVLFVPLLLALPALYPWAAAGAGGSAELVQQLGWLNRTGYAVRGVAIFAIWIALGWLTVHAPPHRRGAIAAGGMIVYVLTGTLAAVDWVMSLDPEWSSRVFGILFLVGQALAALAFAVAVASWVAARSGAIDERAPKTLRDLGNLLLTFLLLWTYLEFMQLLVVWNGNLPRGIPWYLRRSEGSWAAVAIALAVLHFAVPFFLLLFRANKENPRRLFGIAVWLLAMRVLDDIWMVMPALSEGLSWVDVAVPLAMGGLLLAWFCRRLGGGGSGTALARGGVA